MLQKKKKEINTGKSIAKSANSKPVKIIGFGNIMMGDDAIGIKIIEELKKEKFSNNFKDIEIIDGATSGADLLFMLDNFDRAIIIDAIDAGQPEGKVVKFKLCDIENVPAEKIKSFSLHDLNLNEIFKLMKSLKIFPDITIIGIKPEFIGYSDKLSPEIERRIPEIITMIKLEISKKE